ncbi:MAG: gfo/Idh/MocA family oxidoreductase, partial [Bacteroidia bacterium]|nr:gfo/Idh/MocA family oxidoreductase [Bacteroidia bacterium]
MSSNRNSRRSFLKNALLLSAATMLPTIRTRALGSTERAAGLAKASERINVACIGIGNRGGSDVRSLYETGLCNIVALCDVDMGAPHT